METSYTITCVINFSGSTLEVQLLMQPSQTGSTMEVLSVPPMSLSQEKFFIFTFYFYCYTRIFNSRAISSVGRASRLHRCKKKKFFLCKSSSSNKYNLSYLQNYSSWKYYGSRMVHLVILKDQCLCGY